jgi:hypothetical protein
MTPGAYDLPAMVRGDTFLGRDIATITRDDEPLALASARMQIRTRIDEDIVHTWDTLAAAPNAEIAGDDLNIVRLHPVSHLVTATWPVDTHIYDLEVTLSTGEVLTILAGAAPVLSDTTRTA